jgi:RimJ/RimL family protein N-acetyltransferase
MPTIAFLEWAYCRSSVDGNWHEFDPAGGRASRSIGLHRAELTVRENNASAIGLYKKVDFEIKGLQRDTVRIDGIYGIDGIYESIVCMAILL